MGGGAVSLAVLALGPHATMHRTATGLLLLLAAELLPAAAALTVPRPSEPQLRLMQRGYGSGSGSAGGSSMHR